MFRLVSYYHYYKLRYAVVSVLVLVLFVLRFEYGIGLRDYRIFDTYDYVGYGKCSTWLHSLLYLLWDTSQKVGIRHFWQFFFNKRSILRFHDAHTEIGIIAKIRLPIGNNREYHRNWVPDFLMLGKSDSRSGLSPKSDLQSGVLRKSDLQFQIQSGNWDYHQLQLGNQDYCQLQSGNWIIANSLPTPIGNIGNPISQYQEIRFLIGTHWEYHQNWVSNRDPPGVMESH